MRLQLCDCVGASLIICFAAFGNSHVDVRKPQPQQHHGVFKAENWWSAERSRMWEVFRGRWFVFPGELLSVTRTLQVKQVTEGNVPCTGLTSAVNTEDSAPDEKRMGWFIKRVANWPLCFPTTTWEIFLSCIPQRSLVFTGGWTNHLLWSWQLGKMTFGTHEF